VAAGPFVFAVVGDQLLTPCRVSLVIWEGVTTAGDTVELRDPQTNGLVWKGRAVGTQTYDGAAFGPFGMHLPNGVRLAQVSAGQVLVYLAER
jgi:hypothetical protein